MSYVFYNPNPRHKRSVGDCTVRALSKALDTTWESAYIDLASEGYEMGDMPSSNAVLNSYLTSNGFRRYVVDNYCPPCYSISDFTNEHFRGVYILCTGTHVVASISGSYFDSWDSGDEPVIFYYMKENKEEW